MGLRRANTEDIAASGNFGIGRPRHSRRRKRFDIGSEARKETAP